MAERFEAFWIPRRYVDVCITLMGTLMRVLIPSVRELIPFEPTYLLHASALY